MSLIAVAASIALGHAQIDPKIVIWRTYKAGAYSSAKEQRIVEMDTLADYQQYINMYRPEGAGDAHDIDWNKELLVAIHIGPRSTGGYSVEVNSITKVKPTEACVAWAELTPVPGIAKSQGETSPWTIVRLNRPGVRLTYSGHKEQGRLPGGIKIINFGGYGWGCNCCAACTREHQFRLPWQLYAKGDNTSVLFGSTVTIGSADDLVNFERNYSMQSLGDGHDIDWTRERLVSIFLGSKVYSGSQILVDHIDLVDAARVDVAYYQVDPVARQFAFGGSSPYMVIRIPRAGAYVTATKKTVRDCDRIDLDSCSCGCDSCRYCHGHDR